MNPQSGVNLGSAYGDIVIGDNIDAALDKATRGFDNALSRIGDSISRAGSAMTSAGTAISIAMLPVEKLFVDGINTASNYEDALKEIQARAGLTGEELAMVSEKALQLGADTSFSAQQASDAFLQLLTSGSSLEEAMVQIDAVMAGAAANGTELGFTADALTDIMSAFQLETSKSAETMQALTAAAGASSASFPDLVQAFASGGSVAHDFGMSVEETAAALATMADNGIKGAEAGTQLKSMLTNMARQTDDVTGMWQQLGVSMYDAQGNMRDLDDIIKDLNVAMAGMNDEQRNNVIQTLAGSYGRVGLSALLAADGIDTMTGKMDEQGSMEDIAAARLDTYSGRLDALMGSLETLSIKVMTPFMNDVLKPIIEYITTVVNQLGAWADANQPLVAIGLKVLSVLFLLGPALIAIGLALQVIGPAVSALGVALGFLMSPITLAIAGVAALAYVFREPLGAAIQTAMGWLNAIASLFAHLGNIFAANNLADALRWIFANFEDGSTIFGGFALALGATAETADWFGHEVNRVFWDLFGTFSHWFIQTKSLFNRAQQTINGVMTKIRSVFSIFTGLLENGLNPIRAFQYALATIFGNIDWTQAGLDILTGLGNALNTVGSWVTWIYDNLLAPILANVAAAVESVDWVLIARSILNALGSALSTLGIWATWIYDNLFAPMLGSVATAIASTNWTQVGLNILTAIGNGLKTLGSWATWIYDNLLAPILGNGQSAVASVDWTLIGTAILNSLGSALNTLGIWATWIYDNLLAPILANMATAVMSVDWVLVGTTILNALGTALNTLGSWATWIYDNLLAPILANIATAVMSVDWMAVGTSILDALGAALVTLGTWVTWIYDNLLAPILANVAAAVESVDWKDVGANIINAIGIALKAGFDFVAWIIDSIFHPITAGSEAAINQTDWEIVGRGILNGIGDFLTGTFDFILWFSETVVVPLVDGAVEAIANTNWGSIGMNLMNAVGRAMPNIQQWVQEHIITPITNALVGFNPLGGTQTGNPNAFANAYGSTTSPSYNSPSVGGHGSFGAIRDSGGRGYPGLSYMIGTGAQPEMYIPDSPGTFVPNADQLGGKNFYMTIESITAANMQEAAALGDAFGNAFMSKLHNSGYAEDY